MRRGLMMFMLALTTVLSCIDAPKRETKATDINNEQPETTESKSNEAYFTLTLNATVANDDKFTLFYLEIDQENISKENSVSLQVEGNDEPQNLVFQIDKELLPGRLILQYGNNTKSQKITFGNTTLSYMGKEVIIPKNQFHLFFSSNSFITYDKENFTATSKEVNGAYNPVFSSRKTLEDKIDMNL